MPNHENPIFCSQYGEDLLLAAVFADQERGYYVDIGSHNGTHLSNTQYFEQIGWTGLLVEAHSKLFNSLKSNRKASVCTNAAVSEDDGEIVFYETPNGSLSTFDPAQRDYFISKRSEVSKKSYRETTVRTAGTTTLLDEANAPSTIDFMSIDIEGAELQALRSLDFNKYHVRVFIVELDSKLRGSSRQVKELLSGKGYKIARMVGVNAFFVKEEELATQISQLPFSGEVNHFDNSTGEVVCDTVSVSFAAGENSMRRSFRTRLRQSFEKRLHKYIKKAA